jgi:hypothetical protein
VTQLNGSAQNVATPAFSVSAGAGAFWCGWKQDDNTGTTLAGLSLVANVSTVTGNDMSMFILGAIASVAAVAPANTIVVTGGAAAISRGAGFSIPKAAYVLRETGTITVALTQIWLKNVQRPYLNLPVTVVDFSDEEFEDRSGIFPVVARTYPVAVTELRAGRKQTITVTVPDLYQADDLRNRLMSGETVFLHTPDTAGGCPIPSYYAVIGNIRKSRQSKSARATRRYFELPLTEVAAPASTIVGTTITWADVIATYATWADVIAVEPTWSDLIDSVAVPADVIVP